MSKILLSTDIGSDPDDALSLLSMLNNPDIGLRGIYTVNGKVNCRAYIVKQMLNLAQKNIPIGVGTSKSIDGKLEPYTFHEEFLFDYDHFVDKKATNSSGSKIIYKSLNKLGIIENGLEHMAEQLRNDKHIVFSIAPLTDISLLKKIYPESFKNIERLFIMGSNVEGELEHNFRFDSVAANEVLSSDVPITLIPSYLCSKFRIPLEMLDSLDNTLVGQYVKMMVYAFVGEKLIDKTGGELVDGIDFTSFLRRLSASNGDGKVENEEHFRISNFNKCFLTNFENGSPSLAQSDFWKDFDEFVNNLKNPNLSYVYEGSYVGTYMGSMAAERLESLIPKFISIADVYVPYCYLHPDKLKTKRMTVNCDYKGNTYVTKGNKHEVVVDLDFEHFKQFLKESLH